MPFVNKLPLIILPKYDTRHVVILMDVPAHDKIIIEKVLELDPLLCAFTLVVFAVLVLCDDTLQ